MWGKKGEREVTLLSTSSVKVLQRVGCRKKEIFNEGIIDTNLKYGDWLGIGIDYPGPEQWTGFHVVSLRNGNLDLNPNAHRFVKNNQCTRFLYIDALDIPPGGDCPRISLFLLTCLSSIFTFVSFFFFSFFFFCVSLRYVRVSFCL